VAAETKKQKIIQEILKWAEEKLTTEEKKMNLLLATDHKRRTVFHVAVEGNALQILQEILRWAEQKSTTEQIKRNCY